MKKLKKKIYFNLCLLIIFTFLIYSIFFKISYSNPFPKRIISLSPSLTEILFSIGAGDQVVAVDKYSNYPPEAPTTLLSSMEPNLESISEYNPDLVLLSYDIGRVVQALNKIGVESILLPAAQNFEDVLLQIRYLGKKTGNRQKSNLLAEKLKKEMKSLIYIRQKEEKLKIYHELDENYYSASINSFIGNIYHLLNFNNIADIADKDGSGYPKLSPEHILSQNPDIIILTNKDADYINKVKKRPGWSTLKAVKKNNFIILSPDIGSRWGPRIIEFAQEVVKKSDFE